MYVQPSKKIVALFSSTFWQSLLYPSGSRAALHFCIFSVSLVFSLSYFSKIKLQYPLSHFRLLLNAALYNAEITMRLRVAHKCNERTHVYTHTHREIEREREGMKYKTFLLECNFGKYLSRAMWTMIFVKFSLNFMKNACRVSYFTFTFRQHAVAAAVKEANEAVDNKICWQ